MLCHRCSHPLEAQTDRCTRCLAVNPRNTDPELQEAPSPCEHAGDPPRAAQLLAWSVDLAILAACTAGHIALAYALLGASPPGRRGSAGADYAFDLLRGGGLPVLWLALLGVIAVAYSWTFGALGGRTPGLAVAGLRIATLRGGAPTPREALARAALSLPSAALGLFGFALALVDPRGQTLHDKLAGTRLERF